MQAFNGRSFVRAGVLGSIAMCSMQSHAQEADRPGKEQSVRGGSTDSLENIVVTGSRIARRDYQAESPIVTVTARDIQVSGQPTIGEALNQLPQVSAGFSATDTRSSSGGQTTVDLRGLGSRRTLVLLDGKRFQPSDIYNTIDLNGIPQSLISGVEIITGGASAVYGSDALAGVVNFQLRKDFTGLEFDVQGGMTDESDGENGTISATFGKSFAEGRGNIVLSASYLDREEVFPQTSRDFFSESTPGSLNLGGVIVAQGNNLYNPAVISSVFQSYGTPSPGIGGAFLLATNPDGTLFAPRVANGLNFRGFPGVETTTLNGTVGALGGQDSTLALPLERYTAFARGSYDVTDTINAYVQINWSTFETESQADAIVLPQDAPFVPVTNPFIPADLRALLASRPNPSAPFFWSAATNAAGFGGSRNESDVWQGQIGLTGKLPSPGWSWDVYVGTGETKQSRTTFNVFSRSAFSTLLNAPDGGQSICDGGLDLFPLINVSRSCQAVLTRDPVSDRTLTQDLAEANLTGGLFSMPAGEVRFASGLAYRRNKFDFDPDPGIVDNPATGLPDLIISTDQTAPANGSTDVVEGYVELLVPLLSEKPAFERLDLNVAYRYSDYDTIGAVDTYKGSLEWIPVQGFLMRGGFQRAIRAPSIGELFAPAALGVSTLGNNFATGGGDPCDVRGVYRRGPNGAQVAALCVAQGIPAADVGTWQVDGTGVPTLVSGNLDLKEETGDSITVGAVFTPRFSSPLASGLSASVDYYKIEIEDAMGIIPGNVVVRACFNTGGENPTYSADNFYCDLIERGFISLQQVRTPTVNLARIRVSGIDTQLDWPVELAALGASGVPGSLIFNLNVSYLDKYEISSLPGTPLLDFSDTIGNDALGGLSHPTWKGTGTLTYANNAFQVGVRARYIGGMDNSQNVNTALTLEGVSSITYYDLFARADIGERWSVRAGVTNVADEEPPEWIGLGQTDRATYDVVGRSFYLGATARF
jgi:iron complex outermembrane recepter protein